MITCTRITDTEEDMDVGAEEVVEEVVIGDMSEHKDKAEQIMGRTEEITTTPMETVHMLEVIAVLQDLITETKLLSPI